MCIERNSSWWQAGRARLTKTPEGIASHIEPAVPYIRKAFDFATQKQWRSSISELMTAVNMEHSKTVRGYLKQQLAEYINFEDPVEAQRTLLSGFTDNPGILRPIEGISYYKISSPTRSQAQASEEYVRTRFLEPNDFICGINVLLGDLSWNPDRTDAFEAAMQELGILLGFCSQRPDKLYKNGGPDNLWAVGGLKYFLIECKSGVLDYKKPISKEYCNQLLGAISWFHRTYSNSCIAVPISIHPCGKFDNTASPSEAMRVIDDSCLKKIKAAVIGFSKAVIAGGDGFQQVEKFGEALQHFGLTETQFIAKYTISAR